MTTRQKSRGLYEPSTEHDACGVGFATHIKGEKSRAIVEQGLEILNRLSHRGACGCDPETGDGAGILVQLPHRFFKREGLRLGFDIPRRRRYGVGQVFLPSDPAQRAACERIFEEVVADEGQRMLGWRDVPVLPEFAGTMARSVMPVIRQIYVGRKRVIPSAFERKLYVIRKMTQNRVRQAGVDPEGRFHVASLSGETIVYKGLLLPRQLKAFYPDLADDDMVSAIALVHSRFSTNTFPTWDLAQPFRYICHNGEINTVRGNRNWVAARRSLLQSAKFWGSLDRLIPFVVPGKSDSAQFDNLLELLTLAGRPLPSAMMMMIPEAWENNDLMDPERRAFYEYTGSLIEPWDGPAAIAFTDGHVIGATLDRNGLRPARYVITTDDRVILSSEVGVLDIPSSQIAEKGRLKPGRMFLVDTTEGRIISDPEIKHDITSRWPYRKWLDKNVMSLSKLRNRPPPPNIEGPELLLQQRAFGYSDEDVRLLLGPMAETGHEPIGSMGTDTPLAVLSDRAPSLFRYFHQLFAQVTNPAIDPIRESLVMSLHTPIGPESNTFEETPEQCHRLIIPSPVLTNAELAKIKQLSVGAFEPTTISMLFDRTDGPSALERALERVCRRAVEAIDEGFNFLVLSDRGVDVRWVPIPALLALSAVNNHLVGEGIRMHAGLLVETGEVREVHGFAALISYGAAAINPYLALDTVRSMALDGAVTQTPEDAEAHFIQSVNKGLLKVMSKMGISTVASYRGAQMFEAVGLAGSLVEQHFTGTSSRVGGIGLEELGREVLARHDRGFGPGMRFDGDVLPIAGDYQWRRRGEAHKWNPATISRLQQAAATRDAALFREFSELMDDESEQPVTLRGLLAFAEEEGRSIPIEEVEPATSIVKRFVTGAMSFGSISAEAHETLAIAMNRIGARSNSGEGGEEPERFVPLPNGDSRRSAIKQVASGRFGVTTHYLVNADDLQIKVAQGAKPGEGGQLPGYKVDERIARVRCSTPGVTLISPPPHHDIYSIEDLGQLIYDLHAVNAKARVSVKLVSEVGVGTIAAGVAKAGAEAVVIAGWSGGTGASPQSSIKHAGLPWELGLAETQQVLVQNRLRHRIRVQVDGGFRTGRDVVIAALLGAEEYGFATAALVVEGCVLLRKCHLNTCSVGIATQDPELRKRFTGQADHVVNFFFLIAEEVRQYMARLGFRSIDEMVGRVDRLRVRDDITHWKARKLDLSALLFEPEVAEDTSCRQTTPQDREQKELLDNLILESVQEALDGGPPALVELPITNADRAVGARLSSEIALRYANRGLPDGAIHVRLTGSAGQSFGAFLTKGVTLELEGEANDYLGKGLSGGTIIVRPPADRRFDASTSIIVGNVVGYGATAGDIFVSGVAGERFAVRNSGARAVVEGVGDHGCEYMTGGVVVVLGPTGRNFAAGMSGGVAYVYNPNKVFRARCNTKMVELESLFDESDIWLVFNMIEQHVRWTNSELGTRLLDNWRLMVPQFLKVMPVEYKRVLQSQRSAPSRRPWDMRDQSKGDR